MKISTKPKVSTSELPKRNDAYLQKSFLSTLSHFPDVLTRESILSSAGDATLSRISNTNSISSFDGTVSNVRDFAQSSQQ